MQNFFLSCKKIRIEPTSPKTYYGCFYLGPFENGQGLTVANSLRRTLLSEISGLAITSVKVNSASHEYSTLPGVRETVLDILLNLKEIILTKKNNKPIKQTQLGYLQARGPGIIRASDLRLPPTLQCVDPDQYIATLAENGFLSLKFKIDEGKNFIFSKNPFEKSSFHTTVLPSHEYFLPIDAVFTPIKKVNYTIESYGAESIEKANQVIILEVWTNGSVSPKTAVSQTLNYLRILFDGLGNLKVLQSTLTSHSLNENKKFRKVFKRINNNIDLFQRDYSNKRVSGVESPFLKATIRSNFSPIDSLKTFVHDKREPVRKPIIQELMSKKNSLFLNTPMEKDYLEKINEQTIKDWKNRNINDLGLPFRVFNCFYKAKIQLVGQILEMSSKELTEISGIGQQSLLVLEENLKLKGLTLKKD
jgi:DNA-directed RNA polymerase subunit alpha